ncbi:MAG: hypothetical protein H7338_21705, partial [Candidatus Sericytochromatia bacterium]|nr:hypothetical protein [Candidatus Sericytochromatia bacterium]
RFIGDLQAPDEQVPKGTYESLVFHPQDLLDELSQPRMSLRAQGADRLDNQVAMALEGLARGRKQAAVVGATVTGMVTMIRHDFAENPQLRPRYTQYLERLTTSINYHLDPKRNDIPPEGDIPLRGFDEAGGRAALEFIDTLRQQLDLQNSGPSVPATTRI